MVSSWEKRKATQKMQDYIEAHLNDPITLHDLARVTPYSLYYAARIFKEITDKSPFEYIRMRRLSAAAERIRSGRGKIIDAAFDFVFDSHEGFTRAFSKQFGMSPSNFRKSGRSVFAFMPEAALDYYTKRLRGENVMQEKKKSNVVFVQVLERPKRKLILKRGRKASHYFEYCEEVGCGVWDELSAIKDVLHEPMGLWLPDNLRSEDTSSYVQGVEVAENYREAIPSGFEIIDLSPCKMMVFQGPPFDDKDFEQAVESLWDIINSYTPETIGFSWADEDAPRFQLQPLGYRGYIEGRPVRTVNTPATSGDFGNGAEK